MNTMKVISRGSIGLNGAVFLILFTLKLTGVITWSWLAVTAPLWITAACLLIIALAITVIYAAYSVITGSYK